ncbi:glycosyltransferase family 2 protein [Desulforhopalus sp. 52FAK]
MELKDMRTPVLHGDTELPISVVLPTYNRKETLELLLPLLERQSLPLDQFEVIVSDDGSTDGTQEFLTLYSEKTVNNLKIVLAEENGGPAKARNSALHVASGAIVIIIGDDIEIDEDFVERHYNWHCLHSGEGDAVLGYVTWPEAINPSNFMRWLYSGGRHFFFRYADFRSGHTIDCQNFYTCNVSIKRSLLFQTTLFDESFPYASHEDLELGERLRLKGMNLYFEKTICGYHHHFLHIAGIARRVYLMGYSAKIFWEKVPDRSSVSKKKLRKIIVRLFSFPGIWSLLKKLLSLPENAKQYSPLRWKMILVLSYWLGLSDAERGVSPKEFVKAK